MTTSIRVRPCADDLDDARLRAILCQSFCVSPARKWDNFFRRIGRENVRVARRGAEVVGGLGLYRMGQWFGGRSVPMAGVAAVGVAPERRAEGVAQALMEATLTELHAAGEPLAALYGSTQRVYRKVGFEQAGNRCRYEMPTAAIGRQESDLPVRAVDPARHEAFHALYRERARRGAGNLDRSPAIWERVTSPHEEDPVYAYSAGAEGREEGYAVFSQLALEPGRYELQVRDLVTLTSAASRALWNLFHGHRSMGRRISWHGPATDPIFFFLPEEEHYMVRSNRFLLRIVEVAKALEARGYPEGVEGELHLEVRDDLLPANRGRFVLRVADGRGEVKRGGRGKLRLDVRGLAPLYSGMFSALQLQATGLVEGESEALAMAGRLFAGPEPWMPDMF